MLDKTTTEDHVSRWRFGAFIELFAAWGIAVSQPLLDLLADNPDAFVSRNFTQRGIVMFTISLVVLPPLVMWVVTSRFMRGLSRLVERVLVSLLLAVFVAQIVKNVLDLGGKRYLLVAAAASAVTIVAYIASSSLRRWLRLLALAPLLATSLFFYDSPTGRYVRATTNKDNGQVHLKAPVVMLMLDEFPLQSLLNGNGEIDNVRFPNFARLGGTSTWYRNFSSTSEITHSAVPSFLSGIKPEQGKASIYSDHPETLFSLVSGTHTMNVSELVTRLCPESQCPLGATTGDTSTDWRGMVGQLWDVMKQRLDRTPENELAIFNVEQQDQTGPTAEIGTITSIPQTDVLNVVSLFQEGRFDAWLKNVQPTDRPGFHFLHLLLPHQPWIFWPDGSSYETTYERDWVSTETAWESRVKEQRHVLQVQYLDQLLGRLLDTLVERGLFDQSLVVVAADHGASFDANTHRRSAVGDFSNGTDLMRVPLFVHLPGQTDGVIDDNNIENIDFLPILNNQLNLGVPWTMDGALPKDKSQEQLESKTLYFVNQPFGASKRKEKKVTYDAQKFFSETKVLGHQLTDPSDFLEPLYSQTPHDALRGRSLADFTINGGAVSATLDPDITAQKRKVLVRGEFESAVASDDWFALADGDVIVGLSATIERDGVQRFMGLLPRRTDDKDTSLRLFRIQDSMNLEEITVVE